MEAASSSKTLAIVVCFLLGNSPASEFRRQGVTKKKAYNIQNMEEV
jgi:hypothetical protein